ncbi:MAG: FtsK/SpoIIIE domain-containing protein [Ilumatobacter sp.]
MTLRDADIEVVQLAGVAPVRVTRDPTSGSSRVRIGSSTVEVRRPPTGLLPSRISSGSIARHPSDPWLRVVRRGPSIRPSRSMCDLEVPVDHHDEPSGAGAAGLIGVTATAVGAAVIATVTGHRMFLLFAAVGAMAACATWAAGAVIARRRTVNDRRNAERRADEFGDAVRGRRRGLVAEHRRRHPLLVDTLGVPDGDASATALWHRRLDAVEGALVASIGTGTVRTRPPVSGLGDHAISPVVLRHVSDASRLPSVPAPLSLQPGEVIALAGCGHHGEAVARSLIVQFATWTGPADWSIVVITDDVERWNWVRWLPHAGVVRDAIVDVGGGDAGVGVALDACDRDRLLVVVTDVAESLAACTTPLRRRLADASPVSGLVVVDDSGSAPVVCERILQIGATGSASWNGDLPEADDAVEIEFDGLSRSGAELAARRLAAFVDPEDTTQGSGVLPMSASLDDVIPRSERTPEAVLGRWRTGGADPAPRTAIGRSGDGEVEIDLARDGPHALVAGTTGAGKSELLRTLVIGLAMQVAPEHLNFVLVDYKGGATFDACVGLPHTVGLVTDLDDGLAARALASLDAELHRRERLLRDLGASDLTEYRNRVGDAASHAIARLVVVIDEFAALAEELPDFLRSLVGVAQRGRSLGVHLLLATQRPAGVVSDDIRANTNLRIALRLHDRSDASDVVDDPTPALFSRRTPGRVALRRGPDDLTVFQAARCTAPMTETTDGPTVTHGHRFAESASAVPTTNETTRTELVDAVEAVVEAASLGGHSARHRPWLEPLPFPLAADMLGPHQQGAPAPFGVIDVPTEQDRRPLTWVPDDGPLTLVGSAGSGRTSTLLAVAASTCRSLPPSRLHLFVIDARGDGALDGLASIAQCGGVLRATETERLDRLLRRLVATIDRRVAGADADGADVVLMIDGGASVRNALSPLDRQDGMDRLRRVIDDGPACRVTTVVTEDAASTPLLQSGARWVFAVDDPALARAHLGAVPSVAAHRPGRLRIVGCGLEAQVVHGAPGLVEVAARDRSRPVVDPIGVLPERVSSSFVAGRSRRVRTRVEMCIGVGADDLSVTSLGVVDGDHVLVVGPPRSGVSSTVERCTAAWAEAHRGTGRVIRVARGDDVTVSIGAAVETTPTLVVVDDAHRLDDPGLLASIARGDRPGVTLLAGARADAVRSAYGHWTRDVARSRCGIVMSSAGDDDGDLLGVRVPTRSIVAPRVGLGWLIDDGPLRSCQVAC